MKKKLEHKKVIQEWYEVSLKSTQRRLGEAINKFLKGSPKLDSDKEIAQQKWDENSETLCDYEGDPEGILIYNSEDTKRVIQFICDKIGADYEDVKDLDFKLVCK